MCVCVCVCVGVYVWGGEGGRGTGGCRVFFIVTCIKVAVFLFFLYTSTSEWHLRNSKAFPNIAITVGDSVIICISIMSQCIILYLLCKMYAVYIPGKYT